MHGHIRYQYSLYISYSGFGLGGVFEPVLRAFGVEDHYRHVKFD